MPRKRLYHWTMAANVESIKESGFRLGRGRHLPEGPGVYFSDGPVTSRAGKNALLSVEVDLEAGSGAWKVFPPPFTQDTGETWHVVRSLALIHLDTLRVEDSGGG